ncbi:hypothetical protein IFM89_035710, partial [Coptis chinensis]
FGINGLDVLDNVTYARAYNTDHQAKAFARSSFNDGRDQPVDLQRELGDEVQLAVLAGLDTAIFGLVEKPDCDYFLCIWNSKVGKSFRIQAAQETSQSPNFRVSSSTKYSVGSGVSADVEQVNAGVSTEISNQHEDMEYKSCKLDRYKDSVVAGFDSSSSNDLIDSIDMSL